MKLDKKLKKWIGPVFGTVLFIGAAALVIAEVKMETNPAQKRAVASLARPPGSPLPPIKPIGPEPIYPGSSTSLGKIPVLFSTQILCKAVNVSRKTSVNVPGLKTVSVTQQCTGNTPAGAINYFTTASTYFLNGVKTHRSHFRASTFTK